MVSMDKELDEMDTRMGFLASTGSVAPLVGLFGTVWGIINSFNAIAATQSNSLSAMAPGIAEALFTTAFGLIAAIPAVVAYNKISSDIDRFAKLIQKYTSLLILPENKHGIYCSTARRAQGIQICQQAQCRYQYDKPDGCDDGAVGGVYGCCAVDDFRHCVGFA